ncbi:BMP family ABC transporter substrate-binding protein [Nitriliruptoraceae bacterium ZYF776]|nr:BMP family ABC transporter substrate-binding protein [Profundirhabdus halotolerans]
MDAAEQPETGAEDRHGHDGATGSDGGCGGEGAVDAAALGRQVAHRAERQDRAETLGVVAEVLGAGAVVAEGGELDAGDGVVVEHGHGHASAPEVGGEGAGSLLVRDADPTAARGGPTVRRRTIRSVLVVAALVLAGVACTDEPEEPAPTPQPEATEPTSPSGLRVGVVAPLASEVDASVLEELADGLDALASERDGEVSRVRLVEADGAAFVGDVAALLADDGADVVCVLGRQAAVVVPALADRFPATRFCAAPAALTDPPENVDATFLATDELGHVVGVAAVAMTAPQGGPVETVGVVVAGTERGDPERFVAGLRAGLTGVEATLQVAVDEAAAVEAGQALRSAGVDAVVVDLPAVRAAAVVGELGSRVPVLASRAAVDGLDPDRPVAVFGPRWSRVVAAAVDRASDADRSVPSALGFAGEAFEVTVTDEEVAELVAATIDDLRRGDRDPTAPPPGARATLDLDPDG